MLYCRKYVHTSVASSVSYIMVESQSYELKGSGMYEL